MPKELYYNAFISYSHAADGKLAPALQSGLHRFACPLYRIRALRVFRDETNLSANPKLWSSIQAALAQAEYFVLLASEKAAASPWVKDEISFWLRERSPDTLLLVITDGEVQWDKAKHDFDWNTTTAVPKALEGAFREVPRYLDLRWARTSEDLSIKNPKFLDAIADIAATLHHRPKDEMIGEDVRLHRQTKRITATAIVSLTILLLTSVALAIYAAYEARVAQSRLTLFLETNRKRLARESVVQADRGRPDRGVLLALAALPREPYEHEQRRSLFSETSQSLHVFFDHLLSLVLPVTDGDESSMQLTLSKTADALWYSLIRLPIPTLTLRGTGAGFSPDGRG